MELLKIDIIRCPNCKRQQEAKVMQIKPGSPLVSMIHECIMCHHIIKEADWDVVVDDLGFKPEKPLFSRPQ